MELTAYWHGGGYHYHSSGVGDWIGHVVVGSLINRAVWAVTRGLTASQLIGLAVIACLVLAVWRRRA